MIARVHSAETSLFERLWNFPRKPAVERRRSVVYRIFRLAPGTIVPIRLPFGPWWLAQREYSTHLILNSGYEETETPFVQRFLRKGMVFVDVGANRGYYTLLASKKIGLGGRVIAFEPSPRERRFLKWNLRLNGLKNVKVEAFALGSKPGQSNLFQVDGRRCQDGCAEMTRSLSWGAPLRENEQLLERCSGMGEHEVASAPG